MDAVVAAPPQFSGQMTGCRGGDRASNNALHRMALVRISADKRTRDYMDRQLAHGRSKIEILHVLKRALAREALRLLTQPCAVDDCSELRPSRQHKNIAVTTVFQHFGLWPPSSPTSNEDSNETTSSSRPTTNGLRERDHKPFTAIGASRTNAGFGPKPVPVGWRLSQDPRRSPLAPYCRLDLDQVSYSTSQHNSHLYRSKAPAFRTFYRVASARPLLAPMCF